MMLAEALNELEFRYGDPGLLDYSLVGRYQPLRAADLSEQARAVFGQPRLTVTVLPGAPEQK